MVFLPVSTPAPDNYGGTRPGNNEYANSLVALRAGTGEMIWHYQILHHTIWDYDLAPQPLLVDLPRDGEMVPVVVQNTKQGLIFIFHRETGEPFFPIEERPVPQGDVPGEWYSPTQPFPVKPPPLVKTTVTPDDMWGFTFWDKGKCREVLETLRYGDMYTPPSLQGSVINPWTGGGANWGGPAFDPERGLMIINTSRVMKVSKLVPIEEADKDTKGDDFHYGPAEKMHGTPYAIKDQLFVSPWGAPCNRPPWGGPDRGGPCRRHDHVGCPAGFHRGPSSPADPLEPGRAEHRRSDHYRQRPDIYRRDHGPGLSGLRYRDRCGVMA